MDKFIYAPVGFPAYDNPTMCLAEGSHGVVPYWVYVDINNDEFEEHFATSEEIVDAAVPMPEVLAGVYFLIRNRKVMYVGSSINIISRIRSHQRTKIFDSFTFIPLTEFLSDDELGMYKILKLESEYIDRLNPPWNKKRTHPKQPLS